MTEWVPETINDPQGFRTALCAEGPVETLGSAQDLIAFQNATFGRVMMIDGAIQVTTADEFIYHEAMSHVPLVAHGSARRLLIIGGGDGGILREVLRHPVAAATLVEIDAAVIALAREKFPEICAGAFDDPRATVTIADGARFVAETPERFDVIVVDSPDPVGAGAVLFEPAFYENCAKCLAPGGLMVTQSGMPFLTPDWFRAHIKTLRTVFSEVDVFLSTVPSYTGGPMAHALCRAVASAAATPAPLPFATRYWTPALHGAVFQLPQYVAELTT
ncbi:MAG: polyamine aminopropyltransferase [Pseudomonadota bacterium]